MASDRGKRRIEAVSSNDALEKEKNQPKIPKHEKPYFCYMMINLDQNQKTNTFIEVSRDPFATVNKHNNGGVRNSKTTQSGAPDWILSLIIGPFVKEEDATSLAEKWRGKSRGIRSRRNKGMTLALDKKLTCWDIYKSEKKEGGGS